MRLNPSRARLLKPEELKRRKWNETALTERRKGDKGKVAIALRLRAESTVTLAWIAERLQMGTATHLAHLLHWHRRERKPRLRLASKFSSRQPVARPLAWAHDEKFAQAGRHHYA